MSFRKVLLVPVRQISRSSVLSAIKPLKKTIKLEADEKGVPVETDTEKIANYVCGSNLFIEGGEDIKLKPDSEYPEWLWKIGPPLPLDQLDKNSKAYWLEVQRHMLKQKRYLKTLFRTSTVHK